MTRHYKPITHSGIDQHPDVEREADDALRFADPWKDYEPEEPEFFKERRNYVS